MTGSDLLAEYTWLIERAHRGLLKRLTEKGNLEDWNRVVLRLERMAGNPKHFGEPLADTERRFRSVARRFQE